MMNRQVTFQNLISEVQDVPYGDEKRLEDILKRTRQAITESFGKQYDYLIQLDDISFRPSVHEITYHNHLKGQLLQKFANNSQLGELMEHHKLEESRLREKAWFSGIKWLKNFLDNLSKHIRLLERESDILKFQLRGKNLLINRANDRVIELEIKPRKNDPTKGELDVFIDAPSGIDFKKVQIHKPGKVLSYGNVHLCSWHGFYELRDSELFYPLINLKDRYGNRIPNSDERRHNAIIRQKDIIATPICAISIPMELELKSRLNRSELAVSLDLFILPKNVPWRKFAETTVYRIYNIHEHMACFSPYMHGMLGGGLAEGCIVDINPVEFKLEDGQWDAIVRCIYYNDPATDYGVCFYATRNPIDYALNRGFCEGIQDTPYGEEGLDNKIQSFRDLHETELRRLGLI